MQYSYNNRFSSHSLETGNGMVSENPHQRGSSGMHRPTDTRLHEEGNLFEDDDGKNLTQENPLFGKLPLDFVAKRLSALAPVHAQAVAYTALRLAIYTVLISVVMIAIVGFFARGPTKVTVRVGVDIGQFHMNMIALDRSMDNPEFHTNEELVKGAILRVESVPTGKTFTLERLERELRNFIVSLGESTLLKLSVGVVIRGKVSNGEVEECELPQLVSWNPQFSSILRKTSFVEVFSLEDAILKEVLYSQVVTYSVTDFSGISIGTLCADSALTAALMLDGIRQEHVSAIGKSAVSDLDSYESLSTLDVLLSSLKQSKKEFDQALQTKSSEAMRLLAKSAKAFGWSIASVMNMFEPEEIVLGGDLLQHTTYVSAAMESARHHTSPEAWEKCELSVFRPPDLFGAIAAARSGFNGWMQRERKVK